MKNHGLLGENNLDHLEQLLTRADRLDLAEEVKIFKEQRGMEVDSELLGNWDFCFAFCMCMLVSQCYCLTASSFNYCF